MTNKIPAVGYVRCSTEMQEDSPAQQKKEIEAFAESHGYIINEWYVDFGKSGTTFDNRPEFQRLRQRVENGPEFRAVICYDESRWGRAIDAEENTFWRFLFRKHGVDVVLVKTSIDPGHEYAPMMKAFEGVQASQYSKKLSELTLRGAVNNGIYSNGGLPPFGYKRLAINLKTGDERELRFGEWSISGQEKVLWALGSREHVDTVRSIFEQRAAGNSYLTIAQGLNEKGIPSIRQGRWRGRDQKWSTGTIKSILENKAYLGLRIYNKNSMSKIIAAKKGIEVNSGTVYPHWHKDENEWVIVENAHPAIITPDLWAQVQIQRRRKAKYHPRWYIRKSEYLLSGLLVCSECGYPFQGFSTRKKNHKYFRYDDGGYRNKGICSRLTFDKEKLEQYALERVKEVVLDPEILRRIKFYLDRLQSQRSLLEISERSTLETRLEEIRTKASNLVEAIESKSNGLKPEKLLRRLEELDVEEAAVDTLLQSLDKGSSQVVDIESATKMITDFAEGFEDYFENGSVFERKMLLRKCIDRIIVDRKDEVIRFHIKAVPALPTGVEELLEKTKTEPNESLSSVCSGGGIRTHDLRIMIPTL